MTTGEQIAQDDLEEPPVAGEGKPGNTDDGECAGFRGNDGESDSPPGNLAIGKEISPKRAALAAEAQAKDRDRQQVHADKQEFRCA